MNDTTKGTGDQGTSECLDKLAADLVTGIAVENVASVILPLSSYHLKPVPKTLKGLLARGVKASFCTYFGNLVGVEVRR